MTALPLLALLACGPKPLDDTGPRPCEPTDIEECDGVDNNCDGLVDHIPADTPEPWLVIDDDGLNAYGPDDDGDGYPTYDNGVLACLSAVPDGYLSLLGATDCDDADPERHDLRPEVCNGVDNDCDGTIDGFWGLMDMDGDGYADPSAVTVDVCEELPDELVEWETPADCDDTDGAISPAADEFCGDGVDNDCDGARSCVSLTWVDAAGTCTESFFFHTLRGASHAWPNIVAMVGAAEQNGDCGHLELVPWPALTATDAGVSWAAIPGEPLWSHNHDAGHVTFTGGPEPVTVGIDTFDLTAAGELFDDEIVSDDTE